MHDSFTYSWNSTAFNFFNYIGLFFAMKVGDLVECTNTGDFGVLLEIHYSKSAVHPYFVYWIEDPRADWRRPETLKLADKNEDR